MRYILSAIGLMLAVWVGGDAPPLAAGGWGEETPAPPVKKKRAEKVEDPHPLIGKWLLDGDQLRLIEIRETGELIDSMFPLGGRTWMPVDLETAKIKKDNRVASGGKKKNEEKLVVRGSLRVAEMSFRTSYADKYLYSEKEIANPKRLTLGDGMPHAGDPYICAFELTVPKADCRSGQAELDADQAKKPDRVCLRLCQRSGELAGAYDRVKPDAGDKEVLIFDAWIEKDSGRVIEFSGDGKLVGHNAADGYLILGDWGKIDAAAAKKAKKAANTPNDGDTNADDAADEPLGKDWRLAVVERGSLVVRLGGAIVEGAGIVRCKYSIGFAYAAPYEKTKDLDALKLWNCRVRWTHGEDFLRRKRDSKPGSRIVRILSGERLDVRDDHLLAESVVLRGVNRKEQPQR